jgi:hypothetical protein
MDLIRLDPSPNSNPDETPDDVRQTQYLINKIEDSDQPEDSIAKVPFERFGRGEQNRSHFVVEVTWIDVKGLIRAFIEMGHPDALYLERVIRLADTIEDAGWSPNDPASEDFREIMPPISN